MSETTPLREALEQVAEFERRGHLLASGYHYAGPFDFVLREGVWYEAPTRPHRYPQGAPKKCYGNALNAAVLYGLGYVEGFAASSYAPSLAVHHAWNVQPERGTIVDTTWGAYLDGRMVTPVGVEYVGVLFAPERADAATWDGDATVLDDHRRRWPLLREQWHGEDESVEWPPSPRLELLRAARDGADRAVLERMMAVVEADL